MTNDMSKVTVAVYHESGHAVGAFFLGVPVDEIALDSTRSDEGSVHSPLPIKQIRDSNLRWQYAVVSMLGREAERLVFGRADRDYLEADAEDIAPVSDVIRRRDELPNLSGGTEEPDV